MHLGLRITVPGTHGVLSRRNGSEANESKSKGQTENSCKSSKERTTKGCRKIASPLRKADKSLECSNITSSVLTASFNSACIAFDNDEIDEFVNTEFDDECVVPDTEENNKEGEFVPATVAPKIKTKKAVRFDEVEFREYPMILVDNPSTSSGPPIGIDWQHDPNATVSLDLEEYESARVGRPRNKFELAMPPKIRAKILSDSGFSCKEISRAAKAAKKERQRRSIMAYQEQNDPLFGFDLFAQNNLAERSRNSVNNKNKFNMYQI